VLGEDSISVGVVDMQRCIQESQEGQKVFDALKIKGKSPEET